MGTHPIFESDFDCLTAAKEKLNDIISRGQVKVTETGDFNGYPAPSANELMNQNVAATASQEGNVMEEIVIPHDKCGVVIGKNGNTLRNLRSQFGCSVNLDSTVNSGARFRTVNRFREVNQQPSELLIMIHFN